MKFLTLVFALGFAAQVHAGDAANGEKVFKANCTACHQLTDQKLVGPGMKGVTKRNDEAWLKKWIKDPEGMLKTDAKAQKLQKDSGGAVMTNMLVSYKGADLDKVVDDIIAFLKSNDGGGGAAAAKKKKD